MSVRAVASWLFSQRAAWAARRVSPGIFIICREQTQRESGLEFLERVHCWGSCAWAWHADNGPIHESSALARTFRGLTMTLRASPSPSRLWTPLSIPFSLFSLPPLALFEVAGLLTLRLASPLRKWAYHLPVNVSFQSVLSRVWFNFNIHSWTVPVSPFE